MRIKCNMCVNELNGKCVIKKVTIKPNKSRKCNDYEFDQHKEIARLEKRAMILDKQDRVFKAKQAAAQTVYNKQQPAEQTHPLTGNLDRFRTSVSK